MVRSIGIVAIALVLYACPASAACGIEGVVLYQAEWCGFCRQVKKFFARHNVLYQNRDIDSDPTARQALLEARGTDEIPVTVVDGYTIVGANLEALRAALCIRN